MGRGLAVVLVAVLLAGTVSLLNEPTSASEAQAPPPATASPHKALAPAVATGAFGLDLMRAQSPGNLVLSPESVGAALAMTGTGAAGNTATQIAQTLHLSGPAVLDALGNLQRTIGNEQASAGQGHPKAPTLEMTNGLFLQQGFPIEPPFLSGLQQHFGATPETVDFTGDPSGSLEAINRWASDHTEGLIPRLLDQLPEEMRLALANAVYLKANWLHPFERGETGSAPFYNQAGKTPVQFMHEIERLRYGSGPDYKAVDLPYRASTLSLLVVLPVGKRLGSLQRHLDARGLAQIVQSLSRRPVELSLPRFHLSTHTALDESLKKLGMTDAFGESANFSRITAATPLKIGFVEHAADFTVDEEGTVAAATTAVGVVETSAPAVPRNAVTFNANRPFLFFLRDVQTGTVLFAGRLISPASAGA
ncbi:MAG: serpin family protein [Solirubrobacterales bacterium]